MSGNQTSSTNQTQTQVANPVAQAAISPIASLAPGIATTPYSSSMNTNVAGLNPQQLAAIQGLGGLQTNNPANSYISQAALYSNQAADPNNVINMQKAFYNPMSDAVIKQMQNVFGQQSAQTLGNAAASGAIGGSRAPIAAENLINQQDLALGQTLSGLQQQALNAAQTQQGQISQQAFTQGQIGQEALNTQIQGINQALLGGNITQQQAQQLLNAAQQNAIQQTLFPQQEAAAAMNIAQGAIPLGGTTYGTGTTKQPVNYAGQIIGAGLAGVGAMGGAGGIQSLFGGGGSDQPVFGAYGGAIRKRQEGGGVADSSPLESYFAHQPQVNVAQAHYPTLNLGQQGGQGAAGQSTGAGGGGLGGLGSLASLGSSAMGGLSGIGSAIGSGIGELGGALGGVLSSAGEFLPMLALLKDGGAVKHRAIGGGTGVGNGTTGLLGYSGLSSGLEPYFAQHPKVNVSQAHFPTLSLGQQGPNTAQQQVDQQTQQMAQLGKLGADLGQSGGLTGTLGADFGDSDRTFATGGRIHRDYGGGVTPLFMEGADQQPLLTNPVYRMGSATPALGDLVDRGEAQRLPGSPITLAALPAQGLTPSVTPAQPTGPDNLERFLNERRSTALHASPADYGASTPAPISEPQSVSPPAVQQAEAPTPAQAPAPIAAPKPAPQPSQNQQPQWGTPEWRTWADGYGRTSIQGETGHSSAFQGLGAINTHDTNGSHSYGNYGLNSGGSAQEFVRQYGLDKYGLTAEPGTTQFDWQWKEAASNPVTANVLRRAEIDYYNNHYVNPTVRGMSQYLPVNIASNRSAQEYLIDKSVQQGTGTWDGNSGIGVKHIRRAQQAAEESGGDPVKFVQRMAQLDHAAVGSDFPAALHSGAYSPLGDLNRLKTRVAGALGELGEGIQALPGQIGEGIRGVFGGGAKPQSVLDRADLQPPKPGESELDKRMEEFGFRRNQPQGLGGSLGRALGIQGGLDQQTSNRLVNMGLGMMAAGPTVGVKGFPGAAISALTSAGKGGQFALNQEQQERAQAINLANAAMNQQKLRFEMTRPQEAFSDTVYDPITNQMKFVKRFRQYNPETNSFEWITAPSGTFDSSGAQGDQSIVGPNAYDSPMAARKAIADAQAKNLHGEEFIGTLSPSWADDTRAILAGQRALPPESNKTPQAALKRQLVLQADPNFNDEWLKYQQKWTDPASNIGKARVAQKTAISHMYDAAKSGALDQVPDHKGDITSNLYNKAVIGIERQKNAPWLKQLENHNDVIATEVAKIAAASSQGSALADRNNNREFLDLSQGKESLLGVYRSMVNLMAGRGQDGLEADWKQNASPWSKTPKILSDEDQKKVAFIEQKLADAEAKAGVKAQTKATQEQQQAAPQQFNPRASSLPKVNTDADYEKLQSGTKFIDPDGNTRTKP